jgi:hypothetical protein
MREYRRNPRQRKQTGDLLAEFVEHGFGVFEVGGVEAFGEPVVDVAVKFGLFWNVE